MSGRAQSVAAVVIGVLMGSSAQLMMKKGLVKVGAISLGPGLGSRIFSMLTSPLVITALAMYALSSVFYLFALSREDLSFVYPILALNFVIIAVISRFVLHEAIAPIRLAGIMIVTAGVVLMSVKG